MIFFWAIFDGILIYLGPIIFSNAGLTNTQLGLLLGSSSIFGAGFDLVMAKLVRNPDFRKLYLGFFIACAFVPLILWQAKTIPFFLLVMLLWGLYFDFLNFGNLDFISRYARNSDHTLFYSIISFWKAGGYVIAPILAGLAISASFVDPTIFIVMWGTLGLAFGFFLILMWVSRNRRIKFEKGSEPKGILNELKKWRKIAFVLWSPLSFTLLLCVYDAYFYTIGPLLAESLADLHPLNSLVVVAYWLPTFLVSLFAPRLVKRFGTQKTAYWGLFFAAIPLVVFGVTNSPWVIIGLIFVSAIFSTFSFPAINSAYVDFISQARIYEEDIQGVGDFMTNMGYVIGPILAGILADKWGYAGSFVVLGIMLLLVCGLLIKYTPRHINVLRVFKA